MARADVAWLAVEALMQPEADCVTLEVFGCEPSGGEEGGQEGSRVFAGLKKDEEKQKE